MFPFLNNNPYIEPQFNYNLNYEDQRPFQMTLNPYFYPFMNPNFHLQHQSPVPSHLFNPQEAYFFPSDNHFAQKINLGPNKKKRITKKLILVDVQKKIRALNSEFKIRRKSLKYFDPSRAPPLTSLRNEQELKLDLKYQCEKTGRQFLNEQQFSPKTQEAIKKLQILLKQPNPIDYPFLICKRRKYHRNLKRRYSVAYFEQRAVYIVNKKPIPVSLHPKNKVRKPRVPKNNVGQFSSSQEDSILSQFISDEEQSQNMMEEPQKMRNSEQKLKQKGPVSRSEIKQQIESERVSKQDN